MTGVCGTKQCWVADGAVGGPGAGFVIPPGVAQGWVCYPAVCGTGLGLLSRCPGQGWVCYPAVGAGLGLLSRCWSRAGFVIPLLVVWLWSCLCVWLRQGWVCYPAVRAGLGLLSRCRNKAGFVTPLLENSVLLASERLSRAGCVIPGAATSRTISRSYGPALLKC